MRTPRAVQVGSAAEERQIGPITQTHIVRFAGAGGDFNPLHHDPAFAAGAGFRSVIAMGQMQAGMLAGFVTDWLGVENLREFEARFVAPVHVGDVLQLRAEVTAFDESIAIVQAVASVDGRPVVAATAKAIITIS
jgi:3-hydroxybutyryl-CoA dehydratase